MTRKIIGPLVLIAALTLPASAFAWSGAKINSVSCPEIHTVLPVENGPWKVLAVDEQGHTLVNVNVPGNPSEQIIGGLWLLDNGTHQVKVTVGNAANINDGKVTRTTQMTNCASPLGAPGPPGPAGPAGPPGQNGKDSNSSSSSTTVIIHEAPKLCTSKRDYAFRVRKTYMGKRIVSVKASEPGIKVKVSHSQGRLVVRWSTKGKKYTAGGVLRSIQVIATLSNGKHVRMQWLYRPCLGPDNNLNDPSAAGQGSGGGTTAAIT